jgi:hypothetical protein
LSGGDILYLAHHGIKGQKWGVWNAETAARRNRSAKRKGIKEANRYLKRTGQQKRKIDLRKDLNDQEFDQWAMDEGNAQDSYIKSIQHRKISKNSESWSRYVNEGQAFIDAYMQELGYKY